jgi:Fe-S cluster assembly protein SufD
MIEGAHAPIHIQGVQIYNRYDFMVAYPEKLTIVHEPTRKTFSLDACKHDLVIYVPHGVTVPIHLQTVVALVKTERITLIIEDHVSVIIHDMAISDQTKRSIEVILSDYAHVTYVHYQDLPASVDHVATYTFYLSDYSSLRYTSLITGSQSTNTWLDVRMNGHHAHADMRGIWLLDHTRTITMTTMQHHYGPHNTSSLRIKSAVRDSARSVYHGTVHIAEQACGTHATQENKNILLSEKASACSIPNLEALTHDVHCAHGTAVGQLDEEHLLYLQTRGISYKNAQRMILQGFLADVVPDYMTEQMHTLYVDRIAQWLDT